MRVFFLPKRSGPNQPMLERLAHYLLRLPVGLDRLPMNKARDPSPEECLRRVARSRILKVRGGRRRKNRSERVNNCPILLGPLKPMGKKYRVIEPDEGSKLPTAAIE